MSKKIINLKEQQEIENLEREFQQRLQGEKPKQIYKQSYNEFVKNLNDELERDLKKLEQKEQKQKRIKEIKKGIEKPNQEIEQIVNINNYHQFNSILHKIQIQKIIKENPNKLYVHEVEFYDKNGNLKNGIINVSKSNPYFGDVEKINVDKKFFKFKHLTKSRWRTIWFKLCSGSSMFWNILVWLGENEKNYAIVRTKAFNKINYDNRDNKQVYKENISDSCFYDGILSYFTNKYNSNKDKSAKAIINKLTKNEDKYKKPYTEEEIKNFCIEFKISITIKDFITNNDIKINQNKFNKFNIEFINTKYNHLDLLLNNYNNIEEVNNITYEEIKKNSDFYIESYGKLTTINKTYTKTKTDFQKVYNKWVEDNKLNNLSIKTDSNEYNLLEQYDYNMHRFFNKYNNVESDYKEIDIRSAYYNYSNKDFNKFYIGVPSGSFINHSCDDKFNIETLKEQIKNKLVGFYQVKIIKIKSNKNLDVLGFNLNSIHTLFSQMIILLSDYVEFKFLNASIAPSVHIPFTDNFLNKETIDGDEIKYYVKAFGLLIKEDDDIKINIKPLEQDKNFYKTFHKKNYNVYNEGDIFSIVIEKDYKKSFCHIGYSIHSYTTILILNELLQMDLNKVLGVKLDSIVIDKNYNYKFDEKIFKLKEAKLEKMFDGFGNLNFDLDDYIEEDIKKHTALNDKSVLFIGKYKQESNEILKFNKIFTPNGEYITKKHIFFGGMGGTGKTHTILNNIPNENICFTSISWDLIQNKQNQHEKIIGLSIPKITGYCEGQKVEQIKNNNIRFVVIDEMTLTNSDDIEKIINIFPNCFIFFLGDITVDGFAYQCSVSRNYFKPNNNIQYIQFNKTYRFNDELNEKLLKLRNFMYDNKDELNNINNLKRYFKNLFNDRFFQADKIKFNDDDIGISTYDDFKKENELTNYFIDKGSNPQYFIKNTNIHKGQLRGQKLENKPEHNNYECKLFKTIHSFQGRELNHNNKIIIFLGRLFDYNLLYTAVSRARRTDQIYIFENY